MLAKEKLGKTVTVRKEPRATADGQGSIAPYADVSYNRIVADADPAHANDLNYLWLELENGGYANYKYPPAGERFTLVGGGGPVLVHTIQVYDNGSLVIDGQPYS